MTRTVAVAIIGACLVASCSSALASAKPFSVVAMQTSHKASSTASSFTENLFSGTKVVGQDAVKCTASRGKKNCTGTFTFKAGGTITMNSAPGSQGTSTTFKISGGTGRYKSASGKIVLARISGTKTKITFELK